MKRQPTIWLSAWRLVPVLQEIADDDATPTKYQDIAREFVRAMEEKRAADK